MSDTSGRFHLSIRDRLAVATKTQKDKRWANALQGARLSPNWLPDDSATDRTSAPHSKNTTWRIVVLEDGTPFISHVNGDESKDLAACYRNEAKSATMETLRHIEEVEAARLEAIHASADQTRYKGALAASALVIEHLSGLQRLAKATINTLTSKLNPSVTLWKKETQDHLKPLMKNGEPIPAWLLDITEYDYARCEEDHREAFCSLRKNAAQLTREQSRLETVTQQAKTTVLENDFSDYRRELKDLTAIRSKIEQCGDKVDSGGAPKGWRDMTFEQFLTFLPDKLAATDGQTKATNTHDQERSVPLTTRTQVCVSDPEDKGDKSDSKDETGELSTTESESVAIQFSLVPPLRFTEAEAAKIDEDHKFSDRAPEQQGPGWQLVPQKGRRDPKLVRTGDTMSVVQSLRRDASTRSDPRPKCSDAQQSRQRRTQPSIKMKPVGSSDISANLEHGGAPILEHWRPSLPTSEDDTKAWNAPNHMKPGQNEMASVGSVTDHDGDDAPHRKEGDARFAKRTTHGGVTVENAINPDRAIQETRNGRQNPQSPIPDIRLNDQPISDIDYCDNTRMSQVATPTQKCSSLTIPDGTRCRSRTSSTPDNASHPSTISRPFDSQDEVIKYVKKRDETVKADRKLMGTERWLALTKRKGPLPTGRSVPSHKDHAHGQRVLRGSYPSNSGPDSKTGSVVWASSEEAARAHLLITDAVRLQNSVTRPHPLDLHRSYPVLQPERVPTNRYQALQALRRAREAPTVCPLADWQTNPHWGEPRHYMSVQDVSSNDLHLYPHQNNISSYAVPIGDSPFVGYPEAQRSASQYPQSFQGALTGLYPNVPYPSQYYSPQYPVHFQAARSVPIGLYQPPWGARGAQYYSGSQESVRDDRFPIVPYDAQDYAPQDYNQEGSSRDTYPDVPYQSRPYEPDPPAIRHLTPTDHSQVESAQRLSVSDPDEAYQCRQYTPRQPRGLGRRPPMTRSKSMPATKSGWRFEDGDSDSDTSEASNEAL